MSDRPSHRLSVAVTALLSIAALATSWAGYQASLWNGKQLAHATNAMVLRTTSTRIATRADQERIVDVQAFTSWLDAYAREDARLAGFYERRFRPEFAPAFRVWTASRPLQTPDAAPTPFALPEYRLAADAESLRLSSAADAESLASQHANRASDGYVLVAVILATVMFFAGSAQHGSHPKLRGFLFSIALVMCVVGVYRLTVLPLAS